MSERHGVVSMNWEGLPVAAVHPFAVVDEDGDVITVRQGNGQVMALTYRTEDGARKAAARYGGDVYNRGAECPA